MNFSIVVAADEQMGIGIENRLPWRLKGDLKYFSEVTTGTLRAQSAASPVETSLELHVQPNLDKKAVPVHTLQQNAVIMGRKTWESLPEKSKPLKDRLNVVLTRSDIALPEGVLRAASFEDALKMLEARVDVREVFVIGGANVFAQTIHHPDLRKIYLTRVLGKFKCDTFFPKIPEGFERTSESVQQEGNGMKYQFLVYEKNC